MRNKPAPQDRPLARNSFPAAWKPISGLWFLLILTCLLSGNAMALPPKEALSKSLYFMAINRDSARFYADQGYRMAMLEENDSLAGIALMLRGEAYFRQNRPRMALLDFAMRQRIAENRGEHLPQARAWMWMGDIYLAIDSLQAAVNAYDEAFAEWQAVGNESRKALSMIQKGRALQGLSANAEARLAYLQALKISRRSYSFHEMALAHEFLGLLYFEIAEYGQAREQLRNALKHFCKGPDDEDRARCLRCLANIGVLEKKYETAARDAKAGLFLAQETGSRNLTMEFYLVLGDIMAGQENFEKASDYYRLNALVRDSLTGQVGARELSEVVLQFEKEKALLAQEKAIQENKLQLAQIALRDGEIKRQQTRFYLILGGMGLSLFFGTFLAYLFIQKNRANRRLSKALSDLNTAQDQLIRSEKLASLGQVTAGIAHEIRNPLNFVNNLSKLSVGMVDELEEELADIEGKALNANQAAMLREYFEDIKSNAQKVLDHGERASRIVRDMLSHSALVEGEKSTFSINELAEEYLKVAFHSQPAIQKGGSNANCDLVFELDPTIGNFTGLRPELGRALLNIMVNAFEAIQIKRESDGADYAPQVLLRTTKTANEICITIQDNGPGISGEDQKRVFDPFFTTKPPIQGTGLGLSLAHETIVRKHKGRIEVSSSAENGTTFKIFLPI